MPERTKESPLDRGEVTLQGRCQVCGAVGEVIAVPDAPPPNAFCRRCAVEYADHLGEREEELPE